MKTHNPKFKSLIEAIHSLVQQQRFTQELAEEVLLKTLTIYALDVKGELPDGLKISKNMAENKAEFVSLVQKLKESNDSQIAAVFSGGEILESLTMPLTHGLITTLLDHPSETVGSLAVDFVSFNMTSHMASDGILANLSVCELISEILAIESSRSIYINSFPSLPMVVVASQKSNAVYYETINKTDLRVSALSLMSPHRFKVSFTNFLENPGYLDSESQLQQFDCGAALPPLGVKIHRDDYKDFDRFNRVALRSNKAEVLSTLHLIGQCSGKVVVSVTESTLFGTVEKDFRQYLVDNGMLEAVISLPAGIWPAASVKTSLLVIEPKGGYNAVRFLDLNETEYVRKTDKRLLELTDQDKILSYLYSTEDLDCAISLSQQEIEENDYFLNCNRYVLDRRQKKVLKLLDKSETVALGDIADVERGLPFKTKDGDYSILEVTTSDLNDIGDISKPTKEVKVSKEDFDKSKSGILQPNDIVLVIQGSAGKLGIVPEVIPSADDEYWMVSKPAIAIRVKSDNIDARFLYAYLSSDIGQTQLASITQGAAIANISLKELRELPIILPSLEKQQQAAALVDDSRQVQRKIQKLKSDFFAKKAELLGL
ncbi:N-6 DNA methylase [Psychrobacter sp. FME5]|uniref:N-6 DNA methylase n=1 Tax=Psychrobacter sp. FME5 TaxID=2487706 RepID=UPI0017883B91|nr:N-6 DNA methylase [Psychrobacter sp. FME5]MBE0445097.1 N-6 DNA methylase [Psychrobacter sp. FME5]